jgi:hypothetical protein
MNEHNGRTITKVLIVQLHWPGFGLGNIKVWHRISCVVTVMQDEPD